MDQRVGYANKAAGVVVYHLAYQRIVSCMHAWYISQYMFIYMHAHAAISCRVAYPNTGCTTNPNALLLGPGGSNPHQCSCHASCFTNASDVDCCEDIGCVRTLKIPLMGIQ